MPDVMTPEQRTWNMSRIRGKNTGPEMALRKALWALGLRYRLHHKVPGKPDIVFVSAKLAIFVDGCFWHGCPDHSVEPQTNQEFWRKKIGRNVHRDREVGVHLQADGWTVVRIWEHQIRQNLDDAVKMVVCCLRRVE